MNQKCCQFVQSKEQQNKMPRSKCSSSEGEASPKVDPLAPCRTEGKDSPCPSIMVGTFNKNNPLRRREYNATLRCKSTSLVCFVHSTYTIYDYVPQNLEYQEDTIKCLYYRYYKMASIKCFPEKKLTMTLAVSAVAHLAANLKF